MHRAKDMVKFTVNIICDGDLCRASRAGPEALDVQTASPDFQKIVDLPSTLGSTNENFPPV